MALPTLTKTWQFSVNNAQAALGSAATDNKTVLLALKNQMLAFGTNPWTVYYSCNSVTAGTAGDGVDRWSTIANIVGGAAGSPHSWIVLKQTGISSNYQLLIAIDPSNANVQLITIKVSASAGFTGGTTTANPTATDQQVLLNGTAWTNITADAALRWSIMQSTDGQCTRMFVFSGGTLQSFWLFDKLANATGGTPGYANSGFSFASGASASPGLAGVTLQNGVAAACVLTGESVANLSIASEVDGVWDIFPIGIACTTTVGARGKFGTLQDIWAGSSGITVGDTYPATGSPLAQFVQITNANVLGGGIILPWNNGPVNLT